MLILSRRVGEGVVLDDKITIKIIDASKGSVRIGIEAPKDVLILREELAQEVKKLNLIAISSPDDLEAIKKFSKKIKKNDL